MTNKIENHLGLVKSIAAKFVRKGFDFDDLYGIGCVALLEAGNSYDSTKGSFSTWATKIIQQSILDNFRKIKKEKQINFVNFENDVLDSKKKEFPNELLTVLLQEDKNESKIEKENKKILLDHFIHNKSWADIGRKLNLTRERVRQKGFEAIQNIRKKYRLILDDYESIYF